VKGGNANLLYKNNTGVRMGCDDVKIYRILNLPTTIVYSEEIEIFIDFYIPPYNINSLSIEAQQSLNIENAGGKSCFSEAISIDIFNKYYGTKNTQFETEIKYNGRSKMIDYITTSGKKNIGVSVTRAMHHIDASLFTLEDGYKLVMKKLNGLVLAKSSVDKDNSFYTAVLHIFCQTYEILSIVHYILKTLNLNGYMLNDDKNCKFVIMLTMSNDERIYNNVFSF
jgi:hypothetical protein